VSDTLRYERALCQSLIFSPGGVNSVRFIFIGSARIFKSDCHVPILLSRPRCEFSAFVLLAFPLREFQFSTVPALYERSPTSMSSFLCVKFERKLGVSHLSQFSSLARQVAAYHKFWIESVLILLPPLKYLKNFILSNFLFLLTLQP